MIYNEKVLQHFQSPKNLKEIKNPDGMGMGANPTCGDVLKLYLKIEKDVIKEATFSTMGCGAVIASGSILTEYLKGKTLKDAEKLQPKDLVKMMGGLPAIKLHCPDLAIEALHNAAKAAKENKIVKEKSGMK